MTTADKAQNALDQARWRARRQMMIDEMQKTIARQQARIKELETLLHQARRKKKADPQ